MKNPSKNSGQIAKSAGVVSLAIMCSRLLGLVREQVMAAFFGAGTAYDSFVVAFRIPNLLRDLFGEGALSAAFVAVFSDYDQNKGAAATWRLANNVLVCIGILLSVITLLGMYFARPLVMLIASDFSHVAGKVELTRYLTVIMFPFLIFVSLAAVVMGILNSKNRFFIPSLASSFFNIGSIIGGVSLALIMPRFGQPAIVGMAVGTLLGGFLQFIGQLPTLFKSGFRFRPICDLHDPGLRRVFLLMIPAIVGLGATQINIFVNTNFAASCAPGSVSWLNYAFRLVQFPIGVFGVAVSIATMPVISRCAANKDMKSLRETYVSALVMGSCLTIPATIGLYCLATPIIHLLFEHGHFTPYDTLMTSQALSFYVLGLFGYASVKITVPVFYALNDTKYPVIGSFLAVGTNITMIVLTIGSLQHRAIALSTACAMSGDFIFLSIILYRKLNGYSLTYLAVNLAKILLASLIMWLWLTTANKWLTAWMTGGILQNLLGISLIIGSSALLYGVVLYMVGLKELRVLLDKFGSRIWRDIC
ncbi:MAG: murein biosynthesis integral membrane protein MurJ [Deltaproteobacteria bacterium]|nr:murein biosynthesis integral membrane protein MurJ [Deltaproteobacteria bacterium]